LPNFGKIVFKTFTIVLYSLFWKVLMLHIPNSGVGGGNVGGGKEDFGG
jgi:hypothetical protein